MPSAKGQGHTALPARPGKEMEFFLTHAVLDKAVAERPKTLDETKVWMKQRLVSRFHPMNALDTVEGPSLIDGVPGLDGAAWGGYWGDLGDAAGADDEHVLLHNGTNSYVQSSEPGLEGFQDRLCS